MTWTRHIAIAVATCFLAQSGVIFAETRTAPPPRKSAIKPAANGAPVQDSAIAAAVREAYTKFRNVKEGKNADYIPELAKVPSGLFGVAVVTAEGQVYTAGDVNYAFSIQSVSKPFTAALVMRQTGPDSLWKKIGVEPTGQQFNSVLAIETIPERTVNPLVNAGAIATVSLVKAPSAPARFDSIIGFYQKLAGSGLTVLEDVYKSEAATNQRNRAIAYLLFAYERMYSDPMEAVDVYTRQCSIGITAKQLAVMGATLANEGVNPVTNERVIDQKLVPMTLALMTMAGFYNESGVWAFTAGLPAKTGVGGGIVAVVPGSMAIVGFSPRVNEAGNSVRAMRAIEHISRKLDVSIFGHSR